MQPFGPIQCTAVASTGECIMGIDVYMSVLSVPVSARGDTHVREEMYVEKY